MLRRPRKSTQGWRKVGDRECFFRSLWEANFGKYLEWQKAHQLIKEWEHEPKTFWFEGIKRGTVSYKPDFKVTRLDDSHYWVEVKGFFDPKSITKIKRFRKYFPKETLQLIDKKWFSKNNSKMRIIIPEWERGQIDEKGLRLSVYHGSNSVGPPVD